MSTNTGLPAGVKVGDDSGALTIFRKTRRPVNTLLAGLNLHGRPVSMRAPTTLHLSVTSTDGAKHLLRRRQRPSTAITVEPGCGSCHRGCPGKR